MKKSTGRLDVIATPIGNLADLSARARQSLTEADLIVHVRDVHHPESDAQRDDVHAVLSELGLGETVENGLVEALNKIDLVPEDKKIVLRNQARRNVSAVPISAKTGEGCDELLALVDQRLDAHRQTAHLDVPLSNAIDAISIGAGGTGGGAHSLQEWYEPTGRELGLKRAFLTLIGVSGLAEEKSK